MNEQEINMEEKLDNQEKYKPLRNEKGQLLPGQTANPYGRPKGKSLKEYQAEAFRAMTDEQKAQWLIDNKVSGIDAWKMAEGLPQSNTDITSGGLPILTFDKSFDESTSETTESSPL